MLRNTMKVGVVLAAFALASVMVLPRQGRAQEMKGTVQSAAAARAGVLEFSAEKMLADSKQWRAAARLLVEAAGLRAPGDPVAVKDLVLAGGAYYWSNKRTQGREVYVMAGERALADGDVETAARSFLTAAAIANVQRDASVVALKERGERLASSPLLNDAQKRVILDQFRPPVQVVVK